MKAVVPLQSLMTGCLPAAVMKPAELRLLVFKLLAIGGAAGCNIGLNFYNAWAMRGSGDGPHFEFPFFYTMFHPMAGILGSSLIHFFRPPASGTPSFAQAWEYRTVIVPIAILSTLNIGMNNASLTLSTAATTVRASAVHGCSLAATLNSGVLPPLFAVSLFLNQVIKATGPFPTMLCSFFLTGKTYTKLCIGIVAILVSGTILALPMHSHHGSTSLLGVVFVLISTLAVALRPVLLIMAFEGSSSRPKLAPTANPFLHVLGLVTVLGAPALIPKLPATELHCMQQPNSII